ncbi:hypothetical protein [Krasilnikoviella flava]|uniref:Uncharacterized protein n=1 Tax=Krasilnikoviella flava TaxID=526729 RepID=A0A1T5LIJ5_9MICO|nr:hypothetical protein [Krasilnikoviella flava]SKC75803.1 hypothetical protein SAMN04324258_3491 [Krasilnikoviella flava]
MAMLRGAVTLLGLRGGPAATLAVMLLAVVGGLVVAHLGRRTIGRPSHLAFGLAQETGYGEMFFSVLTVWAAALLVWAAVRWRQVVLTLHLRAGPDARAVSGVLVLLAGGLFATGVVLDLLHRFTDGGFPDALLTALEDGGEIAVMSVLVAFLFAVVACGHRPRPGPRLARLMGVRPAPVIAAPPDVRPGVAVPARAP